MERVNENAIKLKVSLIAELIRVVFHGCLHLCGYFDKTKAEKEAMTKREDFYLKPYLKSLP